MTQTQKLWAFDVSTRLPVGAEQSEVSLFVISSLGQVEDQVLGRGGAKDRRASMNLGHWAHGVTGVVNTIHLKSQDFVPEAMQWGSILTWLIGGQFENCLQSSELLTSAFISWREDTPSWTSTLIVESCQWTLLGPNGTLVSLSLKFGLILQGHFEFFKEWLSLTFSPLSPSGSTPFITLKCQSILRDRCYIFAFYNSACPRRDTVSLRKWTPYPVSEGLKPVKETEEAVNPNHILTLSSLSCPLSIPAE